MGQEHAIRIGNQRWLNSATGAAPLGRAGHYFTMSTGVGSFERLTVRQPIKRQSANARLIWRHVGKADHLLRAVFFWKYSVSPKFGS
jgi:hypothetical protein